MTQQMSKDDLLRLLLGNDEAVASGYTMQSAVGRSREWGSRFQPGPYDALVGPVTAQYIDQTVGAGWLSSSVAQNYLRSVLATQTPEQAAFPSPSYDLIAAAHTAKYAATLRRMMGGY